MFFKKTSYATNNFIKPFVPEKKTCEPELIKSFDFLLNWISCLETNHLFYSAINYLAKDYNIRQHRDYVIKRIYPKFLLSEKSYISDEESLVILPEHPFSRHQFKEIAIVRNGKTLAFTASGRYQFIRSTFKSLVKKYHKEELHVFNAQNQDYLALCLAREALLRTKSKNPRYRNLWEEYIDDLYKDYEKLIKNSSYIQAFSSVWEAFEKFADRLSSNAVIQGYNKIL